MDSPIVPSGIRRLTARMKHGCRRDLWLGIVSLLMIGVASAQRMDVWDLPPLRYSDTAATDRVAVMARQLEAGEIPLDGKSPLEKLRFVLETLGVPESSQMLVFSKTSKQINRIRPQNPRSLYFSADVYVGYVPGGAIEVIAHDALLGPVFYLIELGGPQGLDIQRDTSDCLSCHGTARTEGAPGVVVRSVFPDASGHALLSLGSTTVTHETPIENRWGGYYVTGSSFHPHLGNRVFEETGSVEPVKQDLTSLEGRIDVSKYPRATSDVVALVVLEHQCRVHNLFTAGGINYRRARFLAEAVDPGADPDAGQAGRIADTAAAKVVDALLFRNEADLGEGLEGDADFQRDYLAQFPKSASGRSLADFRLYERIFKLRCSCMVYSSAFEHLPARVKRAVIARLKQALSDEDREIAPHLGAPEKKKIRVILSETLPAWNQF